MFELRVMSGLHRGAALPLIGESWCVGASDEADLALYDPGIGALHAQLRCVDGRWSVEAQDGPLSDEQGQRQALIDHLPMGALFAVGGIWLCVVAADQPWPEDAAELIDSAQPAPHPVPRQQGSRPSWAKRVAIALVVITLGTSAWALSVPAVDPQRATPTLQRDAQRPTLETTAEVRRELTRMLQERDLSAWVELEEREERVILKGALAERQLAVAQRMVTQFLDRFDTPIAITDALQPRKNELPFKIVQIIGGKHGHVVTEDGRRLFLGDEIDGLRLTQIDNGSLRFEGEQRYEVTW
ncbi:FHA domain-containing protein [Pseudomonas borbori]